MVRQLDVTPLCTCTVHHTRSFVIHQHEMQARRAEVSPDHSRALVEIFRDRWLFLSQRRRRSESRKSKIGSA